jgi:predicted esterase
MLYDIKSRLEGLKNYEPCPEMLKDMTDLLLYVSRAKTGRDSLLNKTGTFRRGYYSAAGNEFRPYTIRVPSKFTRSNDYPLLVYLHGSGDDDRVAFKMEPVSGDSCIELYPNGMGTSNVYCTPESQSDIKDAINDVIQNYPIDISNIILTGFSMGGYGAYRTFFEQPERFKAIAVFSGHPDLANVWLGEGYPNFLIDKYYSVFKNKKMFIFHGTEDRNCPFTITSEFTGKLKNAGAEVEFITEETGHTAPSEESRQVFLDWLYRIISSKKSTRD